MGFQINNNLAANNSYRNLNATQNDLSKSLEKLSTGLRINRAADDAAGLSISEGLKSQVTGSAQAARNAQDGISVIQTAEGALTEVHSILQRVRDLAVQAGNDSNNADARTAIQTEVTALGDELTRIGDATNFNGIKLLDGSASLTFHIGAGDDANENQITVALTAADISTLGADVKALAFDSATSASASILALDGNIKDISTERSKLGAAQNRLEHTIKSLNVAGENLQAAQSRIADVDMAQEMVKFTKANILSQAGTAMLAQANQSSQGVLSLLR
ncbi:flagellin [Arthrobacter sp. U41]|uniref:flagellin N-terminal helical domain-containing protein n=1 Tax=Arthrobacter sp. U41 TaxID=1849032 RepID=UPI0011AA91F0|nr:flagellin [Arthrobacter sp. U41]